MNRKVVITGLGVVSPIGSDLNSFEKSLWEMKSGVGKIQRFDALKLPTNIAAEVTDVQSEFRDIKIEFAIQASKEAFSNSKIILNEKIKSKLFIGIGLELFSVDDLIKLKKNPALLDQESLTFLNTPSDICAHLIGKKCNLNQSPLLCISACAAGSDAIGRAFREVRSGRVDFALAGGADSMINPMGLAGFSRIGAMTTRNELLDKASAPFNKGRDGFVLGEGAAFLTLENEEHAKARGAKIYATINGYGNSLDAYSVSDPHPEGIGAYKSMNRALIDASISPLQVSAISVHGTGTPKNDPIEALAIKQLLGKKYKKVPAFATKSLIGHCISAAGSIETVASVLSIIRGQIHGTRNLVEVDEGCDLKHIYKTEEFELKYILKNSFGFGGQNASLIIGKYY